VPQLSIFLGRAARLKYFVLLIFSLWTSLTSPQNGCGAQVKKLKIVTSIFPLMEFARAVAAEQGDVSLLLPPGAGVHTWQPRASDIMRLASADLFIYIGAGLEPWISDLLRSVPSGRLETLAAADVLPLEKENADSRGAADPHIWLDFELDRMIVSRIAEILSEMDPSHAAFYRSGAVRYNEKLNQLDEKFSQSLSQCSHKTILLGGHAAFGYLARRFHLQQVSLYGLSPDAEPSPSRLMETVEWAKQHNIKAVYMEANASAKMAKILAGEIHADLLVLNPGANLNKGEWASGLTFIEIMEENLKNLKRGLLCD
jgi:zinc transport system substrate-binding protein